MRWMALLLVMILSPLMALAGSGKMSGGVRVSGGVSFDTGPERNFFQGFLHSGRPSDATFKATYGLKPLNFYNINSFAGWTDATQLPTTTWYNNAAAGMTAPDGWVIVDHETWPNDTQANRLATAAKFATMYGELKSRMPTFKFGFYGYAPKRDLYRAILSTSDPDYLAWQAENDDMAAMVAVVDAMFPSTYWFYNVADNGAAANDNHVLYFQRNLLEAQRLRSTYGKSTQSIYTYVWFEKQDSSGHLLDPIVWFDMITQAYALSDGPLLWGGSGETWDSNAAWWLSFLGISP